MPKIPAAIQPPKWDIADAGAIQALQRGDADAAAQKRALKYIIEQICQTYELSYRPNSDRETSFMEGRRFVGLHIVSLLHVNLMKIK